MFSKKQAAESETEEAVITRLLNAEVSSYIKAQDAKFFDSLKSKLKSGLSKGLSKYMNRGQVDDGADDEVDSDNSDSDSDNDSDSDSDDDDISNEDLDHDGVADYLQNSKISAQEIDEAINRYVLAQAESGDAFLNFSKLKNKLNGVKN